MSIATRIQSMEEHISDAYDSLSKFGVAAPSNKNIENIANLVNEVYDNTPKTDYISGTNLTLENTRVGKIDFKDTDNIEKIGLGATSQDSEPTPDSPQDVNNVSGYNVIGISNKNLLDFTNAKGGTSNGVTATINGNGTFTANGTSTSASVNIWFIGAYSATTTLFTLKPGTYTLTDVNLYSYKDGAHDSLVAGRTYTLTEDFDVVGIRFPTEASETAHNNKVYYPQVEKGSSATFYIAHQENNFDIDLPVENKLPYPYVQTTRTAGGITYTDLGDGRIKINGTATENSSFKLLGEASSQVEIPGNYVYGGVNSNIRVRAMNRTTSGTYTTLGNSTGSSTLINKDTYETGYVEISIASGTTVDNLIITPMLSDKQINTYTPYNEKPIELCKIGTYQDYIYKNNGNWFIHKEIEKLVADDTQNWVKSGNTSVDRFYLKLYDGTLPLFHNMFSNKFNNKYNVSDLNVAWIDVYQTEERLFVNYSTYGTTTLAQFKTWLASALPIFYYPLKTPTETQITDENLIAQLNAWYNAQSMDDITYITVDGDLPMQLKLRALKK